MAISHKSTRYDRKWTNMSSSLKLNQMCYVAMQIQHYRISLQIINLHKKTHVKNIKTAYLHALIRWNTVI